MGSRCNIVIGRYGQIAACTRDWRRGIDVSCAVEDRDCEGVGYIPEGAIVKGFGGCHLPERDGLVVTLGPGDHARLTLLPRDGGIGGDGRVRRSYSCRS